MKKIIVAITGMLMFFGCSNFDEINTNPNTPTEVSASLLATNIILSVAKYQGSDAKEYIAENALPKYVGYANEGQLGTQYNLIANSSFNKITILPDIDKMVLAAQGSPAENSYKGLGHFIRAYTFYMLTMKMGDIPYSEANGGTQGNYKPKYDSQKEVFIGILAQLEQARTEFSQSVAFDGDPTIFKGNPQRWRRACNAFELKVLMTLSAKDSDADLKIKEKFASIVSENMLLQDDSDYFGLEYNSVNLHPLYSTNDMFTGRTILSDIVVDNLKRLNDKRLFYFGEPSADQIAKGLAQNSFIAYTGVKTSLDYGLMNANYASGQYSKINLRYQIKPNSEPRRLLTYAEQELILAEARLKGWITTSNAQLYYENGVKAALKNVMSTDASFAHGNPIVQNDIDTYFSGEAAFATDPATQLKQIWMQRYLLNFLVDGETSYFEYRRNKYPDFNIDPSTNLNVKSPASMPLRYLYPASELNYNSQNLMESLNRQFGGYDEINKTMWLLVN